MVGRPGLTIRADPKIWVLLGSAAGLLNGGRRAPPVPRGPTDATTESQGVPDGMWGPEPGPIKPFFIRDEY